MYINRSLGLGTSFYNLIYMYIEQVCIAILNKIFIKSSTLFMDLEWSFLHQSAFVGN